MRTGADGRVTGEESARGGSGRRASARGAGDRTTAAIDLNCDLGEGLDPWAPGERGLDEALLGVVSSANVACGGHAGDARVMTAVCAAAAERGVAVGAHVSYADREHFGRRVLDVPADVLRAQLRDQVSALRAAADAAGTRVRYVKPHGALYNVVVRDEAHARAVVGAVLDDAEAHGVALPVLGLPGAVVLDLARAAGLPTVTEAFADRGYRPDGTLVPRGEPGALLTDDDVVAERVLRLATHGDVQAVDGSLVRVEAQSVCVHSDTPGAHRLATRVRERLARHGVEVSPFA